MKSTQEEQTILSLAKQNKKSKDELTKALYNRSINQLISGYIIEFEAKNSAYLFILENGHIDEFSEYKNSHP